MKVVLDTNVVISGLLWGGPPGMIFDLVEKGRLTPCVTLRTFAELERTLAYKKIAKKLADAGLTIQSVIEYMEDYSVVFEAVPTARVILDDPSDDMFLDCAVWSGARWIVSGDRHLLRLGVYGNVRIVTPAAFIDLIGS